MKKKPTFRDIAALETLKSECDVMWEKYHDACQKFVNKFGCGVFYDEIEQDANENNFLKVTVDDNIQKLKDGEKVIGISVIKPFSVTIKRQKTKPRS